MDDFRNLPGIKAADLGKTVTGRKLGSDGPVFYRVTIETCCLDPMAIQRQAGLEMMLGSAALAAAMGPNEDVAKVMGKRVAFFTVLEVCDTPLGVALEGD